MDVLVLTCVLQSLRKIYNDLSAVCISGLVHVSDLNYSCDNYSQSSIYHNMKRIRSVYIVCLVQRTEEKFRDGNIISVLSVFLPPLSPPSFSLFETYIHLCAPHYNRIDT